MTEKLIREENVSLLERAAPKINGVLQVVSEGGQPLWNHLVQLEEEGEESAQFLQAALSKVVIQEERDCNPGDVLDAFAGFFNESEEKMRMALFFWVKNLAFQRIPEEVVSRVEQVVSCQSSLAEITERIESLEKEADSLELEIQEIEAAKKLGEALTTTKALQTLINLESETAREAIGPLFRVLLEQLPPNESFSSEGQEVLRQLRDADAVDLNSQLLEETVALLSKMRSDQEDGDLDGARQTLVEKEKEKEGELRGLRRKEGDLEREMKEANQFVEDKLRDVVEKLESEVGVLAVELNLDLRELVSGQLYYPGQAQNLKEIRIKVEHSEIQRRVNEAFSSPETKKLMEEIGEKLREVIDNPANLLRATTPPILKKALGSFLQKAQINGQQLEGVRTDCLASRLRELIEQIANGDEEKRQTILNQFRMGIPVELKSGEFRLEEDVLLRLLGGEEVSFYDEGEEGYLREKIKRWQRILGGEDGKVDEKVLCELISFQGLISGLGGTLFSNSNHFAEEGEFYYSDSEYGEIKLGEVVSNLRALEVMASFLFGVGPEGTRIPTQEDLVKAIYPLYYWKGFSSMQRSLLSLFQLLAFESEDCPGCTVNVGYATDARLAQALANLLMGARKNVVLGVFPWARSAFIRGEQEMDKIFLPDLAPVWDLTSIEDLIGERIPSGFRELWREIQDFPPEFREALFQIDGNFWDKVRAVDQAEDLRAKILHGLNLYIELQMLEENALIARCIEQNNVREFADFWAKLIEGRETSSWHNVCSFEIFVDKILHEFEQLDEEGLEGIKTAMFSLSRLVFSDQDVDVPIRELTLEKLRGHLRAVLTVVPKDLERDSIEDKKLRQLISLLMLVSMKDQLGSFDEIINLVVAHPYLQSLFEEIGQDIPPHSQVGNYNAITIFTEYAYKSDGRSGESFIGGNRRSFSEFVIEIWKKLTEISVLTNSPNSMNRDEEFYKQTGRRWLNLCCLLGGCSKKNYLRAESDDLEYNIKPQRLAYWPVREDEKRPIEFSNEEIKLDLGSEITDALRLIAGGRLLRIKVDEAQVKLENLWSQNPAQRFFEENIDNFFKALFRGDLFHSRLEKLAAIMNRNDLSVSLPEGFSLSGRNISPLFLKEEEGLKTIDSYRGAEIEEFFARLESNGAVVIFGAHCDGKTIFLRTAQQLVEAFGLIEQMSGSNLSVLGNSSVRSATLVNQQDILENLLKEEDLSARLIIVDEADTAFARVFSKLGGIDSCVEELKRRGAKVALVFQSKSSTAKAFEQGWPVFLVKDKRQGRLDAWMRRLTGSPGTRELVRIEGIDDLPEKNLGTTLEKMVSTLGLKTRSYRDIIKAFERIKF